MATWRRASVDTARRLCAALPAPRAVRREALFHMLASRDALLQLPCALRAGDVDVPRVVQDVRHSAYAATHAPSARGARRDYRAVVSTGRVLAGQIDVQAWPIEYVELCLCLHDALCVLDRAASALVFARCADIVLETVDPARLRAAGDRLGALRTNTHRALAVAYLNLEQPIRAERPMLAAEASARRSAHAAHWIVHLHRDRLSYLRRRPRFALAEVHGLADRALDALDCPNPELNALLIRCKLAECLVAHATAHRHAGPVMDALMADAEHSTSLGPLHRTIIYRTYAHACRRRGDTSGARTWSAQALALAQGAGLAHQARTIRAQGG